MCKPGSHLTREMQLIVVGGDTEQDRADAFPRGGWRRKAADKVFAAHQALGLQPELKATFCVTFVNAFGDDAFDTEFASGMENRGTIADKVFTEHNALRTAIGFDQFAENLLPLEQRQAR